MYFFKRTVLMLFLVLIQTALCPAAPSLPVVRPLVAPEQSYTGPPNDTHATKGQWFQSVATAELENRTHEFYDNTPGVGGGAMGHLAISGVVVSVTTAPAPPLGTKIIAFEVLATVHNDTHSNGMNWASGTNSHAESLTTSRVYSNTLKEVILTVDFASCGKMANSDHTDTAYTDYQPYIVSTNHDFRGWYCWNEGRPNTTQFGDFFVPGWSFGDLQPGQSTNRLLQFVVRDVDGGDDGILISDPRDRYTIIMNSSNNQTDIFLNRSTSLKISTWIASPADDDNSELPGSVSVFHNIAGDDTVTIKTPTVHLAPPQIVIESFGSSGVTWQTLQSSTNLTTTNWVNLATNIAWPSETIFWTNSILHPPVQFFRIIQ